MRTRAAIQHHALRLFREQGYEATTIADIAEAAEVSESTFFRYFATKEAVVFHDDYDEPLVAAIRLQPAGLTLIQAMRGAIREVFSSLGVEERLEIQQRAELVFSVPELRAAIAGRIVETFAEMADLLAARAGRAPGEPRVRALAGAVLGAMMAMALTGSEGRPTDYMELVDLALAELEAGLSL